MRARILSGGVGHPFEATSAQVADLLDAVGIGADVTDDLAAGARSLRDDPVDLLVVNALRWRMQADRYAHLRDEWAFSLPEAARAAIDDHVAGGRGLLALHTAAICFDDWPGWGRLVGGAWNWDRSSHPPLGQVHVTVRTDAHPIVAGVGDFDVVDEVYGFLDQEPDVVGLVHSAHGGREHPLLWARGVGAARVVYDALGHDERSFAHPVHQRLVRRAALWASGADDATVEAT